jgi:hypothetical protein
MFFKDFTDRHDGKIWDGSSEFMRSTFHFILPNEVVICFKKGLSIKKRPVARPSLYCIFAMKGRPTFSGAGFV